jgi:hypothetical protein
MADENGDSVIISCFYEWTKTNRAPCDDKDDCLDWHEYLKMDYELK